MKTGYEVTFKDFQMLFSYVPNQVEIAPMFRDWFNYEVRIFAKELILVDESGAHIDLAQVHDVIQSDPERQGRLYRVAMTIWR
ncbi:MAG: hypothetical protein ABJB66_05735 [Gemmatimonadaceae bacterium]